MSDLRFFTDEVIDVALLGVAEGLPRLPEWHEAVRKLGPATPDETRLAVYQAVRDEGSLSKEEGEFLVLFTVDHLLARTSGFERVPMEDRLARRGEISKAARENRLSGEDAAADDDLPESDELALWRGAMRQQLKAHGERMLATWMRTVSDALAGDLRRGRQLFFGRPSRRTARLRRLAQELFDEVCGCIQADEPMGPLRRRWWPDGEGFGTKPKSGIGKKRTETAPFADSQRLNEGAGFGGQGRAEGTSGQPGRRVIRRDGTCPITHNATSNITQISAENPPSQFFAMMQREDEE